MNNNKKNLLPIYSPLTWFYAAGLIYLICIFSSIFLITHQPYLGISFIASQDGESVIVSAIHTQSVQEKLSVGDNIRSITSEDNVDQSLGALSIIEEPDNSKTYFEYNQFIKQQQSIHNILSRPVISVSLSNGPVVQLKPLAKRPISHLPYPFWLLLISAGIGFFIGVWIWVFRRGQIEARLLAVSGLGFMLGACCLAVYSNRELAIDPWQFKILSDLNHLGNITFSYSLLILLCYYPSKIAQKPFALIGYSGLLLIWLNESLQWLEIPIHTFYFLPYIVSSSLGFIVGRMQWIRYKSNPIAKAAIRWFLLTLTLGIGCALVLYFIPTFFNSPPLLPVWAAQFIILFLYIGFIFGVIKYRLFDVEQWWFNCWIWFLSGCSIVAVDLLLIYFFHTSPFESLSAAILVTAWCYFPFRQWLWTKSLHPRSSRVESFFPLLTQSYISSPSLTHFENSWSDILKDIYMPLSVETYPQAIDSVSLSNHGLTMFLPALNKQHHLVLSGKEKGSKLFNKQDVEFIKSALLHAQNCIIWKNNLEIGAQQERERMMRDLHDDVGASLLTLIHKAESEENAVLARNALKGVRDTIYSLRNDKYTPLTTALSDWREEIKQRTDAAQVELLWGIDNISETFFLSPRQRINLDRIIRESITNILKHASPQSISFSLNETDHNKQLIIIDNGHSSDSSCWQANTGLYNLKTRASEINASLRWSSLSSPPSLNTGTQLTITLPKMETKPYALSPNS